MGTIRQQRQALANQQSGNERDKAKAWLNILVQPKDKDGNLILKDDGTPLLLSLGGVAVDEYLLNSRIASSDPEVRNYMQSIKNSFSQFIEEASIGDNKVFKSFVVEIRRTPDKSETLEAQSSVAPINLDDL